jgi:hypothetical protein
MPGASLHERGVNGNLKGRESPSGLYSVMFLIIKKEGYLEACIIKLPLNKKPNLSGVSGGRFMM